MPMSLLVWSALAFATYSAYLGLAPWLRRRPVRITFPVHASVLAVALGPALTVWAFGWVRGTVVPTALAVFTVAFFVVAFAFTWITWRGVHEFHGATAAAFREAWRAALAQLGRAHEVRERGSGRVERLVLDDPSNRVEVHLRSGTLRGFGAAGTASAVEAMERYFAAHDTAVDHADTVVHVVPAVVLLAFVVAQVAP